MGTRQDRSVIQEVAVKSRYCGGACPPRANISTETEPCLLSPGAEPGTKVSALRKDIAVLFIAKSLKPSAFLSTQGAIAHQNAERSSRVTN